MKSRKILVVEDDKIIAANISMQLGSLGYTITAILPSGEDVLSQIASNPPDIILLDINLRGELDGIEIAEMIQKHYKMAIIYLTASTEEAQFTRAKATSPYAFISKPFKQLDLQRAIELAFVRLTDQNNNFDKMEEVTSAVMVNSLFIRSHEKMVKVPIGDIQYIEAERNCCKIHTKDRDHLLVLTLKELEDKIASDIFVRIHRSFIVNLTYIDEIATCYIVVGNKAIPLTADSKKQLLHCIQKVS